MKVLSRARTQLLRSEIQECVTSVFFLSERIAICTEKKENYLLKIGKF